MTNVNRWGLATGLAAALALFGHARAQGPAGSAPSTSTGSADQRQGAGSTAGQPGSATGSRDPSAPAAGTGSASGAQAQKIDEDLQEKLEKIHASNRAELEMAKLGQRQAQSPQVKQFAEQLEQDHQRLDEQLTRTAQSMGVSLEGKEYQKAHEKAMKGMERLSRRTGADFDREFIEHMVDDHEKDVKAVRSAAEEAREGNHADLASLLERAQTGMKGHLAQAQQIEKSLEDQERQRRAAGAGRPGGMGTGSGGQSGTGSGGAGAPGPGAGQSR